jgi:hypothetical protein
LSISPSTFRSSTTMTWWVGKPSLTLSYQPFVSRCLRGAVSNQYLVYVWGGDFGRCC